ncbi:C40 family peptidase [Marinilongibacter aquaticus]|uniref:C40 family peptidase n=1 Tax=Marinilongibacter aquaticus TaxID=2975157 RepID=UPI0021BD89BB|nr:C40 family peptidase [Marinilongibacter aquaticus]UBM59622.1 C40 family peptidase [Marinilongibacter aquaticus]
MKKLTLTISLVMYCFLSFGQEAYSPRVFVKKCRKYMGTPYRFGGNDKKGIDCSGLVHNVFGEFAIDFPRASIEQAAVFKEIKPRKLRKGDLVYFDTSGSRRINHTGVVLKKRGRKKIIFIHAASDGVRKDNLATAYWERRFVKATRPIEYSR